MNPLADQPDPDRVAASVNSCPLVAGLSGGIAGEVATYLPGRRVSGMRVAPGEVEVHVVARYGSRLAQLDHEVRRAVSAVVVGPTTITIVVADVEDPFTPPETAQADRPTSPVG